MSNGAHHSHAAHQHAHHTPGHHINWNGPQPAPRALWLLVHANFRMARFDGIYNRRNIAGTNNPSLHAEGRALDIGLDASNPTEKTIGDGLFKIFIDLAGSMGLQEIIWNRKIWSSSRPRIHDHHGHSPHTDHVHVGFTQRASQNTSFTPILHIRIGELRTGLEEVTNALSSYT